MEPLQDKVAVAYLLKCTFKNRPQGPMRRWGRVREDIKQPEIRQEITCKTKFVSKRKEELLSMWRTLGSIPNSDTLEVIFQLPSTRHTWRTKYHHALPKCTKHRQRFPVLEILSSTFRLSKLVDFAACGAVPSAKEASTFVTAQQGLMPRDTASPSSFVALWGSTDDSF